MSFTSTSDNSFQKDVLEADKPVIVDFYADWCGPCKMFAPVLEEVAREMSDKVKIMKLNIDANPNIPAQFQVRSIPTIVFFKDGEAIDTKVGVLSKAALKEWITLNLNC